MPSPNRMFRWLALTLFAASCDASGVAGDEPLEPLTQVMSALTVNNSTGRSETFTASNTIDTNNEFFQSLGTTAARASLSSSL